MARQRLCRILFISASLALAWYAWSAWASALPQYKNEALVIPTVILYAGTLPVSLLIQLVYTILAHLTPLDRAEFGSGILNWMITTWLPLTVSGYLQWFILAPRMVRYIGDRRIDSSSIRAEIDSSDGRR